MRNWEKFKSNCLKASQRKSILWVGFGIIGAHQLYAGKTKTAMIMRFTLGGVGIWYTFDSLIVRFGEFTDKGKKIKDWV